MKFVFKGLAVAALWCLPVWGRDIVLVSYHLQSEKAQLVRQLLQEKFHLPEKLITVRELRTPCQPRPDTPLWHLCVEDGGDLVVAGQSPLLDELFRIFQKDFPPLVVENAEKGNEAEDKK